MTDTSSVQGGDVADLVLILSGKYTVTKPAGTYIQNDVVPSTLIIKNLVFLYYVDLGDGYLRQAETFEFDGSGNMLKQIFMNLYSGNLRFQYGVFTTGLRDVASSVTIYYKIFRVNVR